MLYTSVGYLDARQSFDTRVASRLASLFPLKVLARSDKKTSKYWQEVRSKKWTWYLVVPSVHAGHIHPVHCCVALATYLVIISLSSLWLMYQHQYVQDVDLTWLTSML